MEIYKNKSHVLVHHVFPKTVSSCFSLSRKTHQINCSTGAFELQFSGPSWTSEVLTSDAQTSRRSNKELDPIQPQSVEAVRWNPDFRLPLAMPSQPCERQKHTHTHKTTSLISNKSRLDSSFCPLKWAESHTNHRTFPLRSQHFFMLMRRW